MVFQKLLSFRNIFFVQMGRSFHEIVKISMWYQEKKSIAYFGLWKENYLKSSGWASNDGYRSPYETWEISKFCVFFCPCHTQIQHQFYQFSKISYDWNLKIVSDAHFIWDFILYRFLFALWKENYLKSRGWPSNAR